MVSFVIPAHDEERLIGATIRAIHHAAAEATVGAYEIIVADDASRDRTAPIAAAAGARVVRLESRRIAAARNAGARVAAGRVLVFVDADTLVSGPALAAALRCLRAGAVGGFAPVRFDGWVPTYARLLLGVVERGCRLARLGGGCFVFCTRAAFRAVGGWDAAVFALEEVAFMTALKRRFGRRRLVMLREPVVTSGRKLRAYSAWEIARLACRLALRGRGACQSRQGLEFWYGPRRADPLGAASAAAPAHGAAAPVARRRAA